MDVNQLETDQTVPVSDSGMEMPEEADIKEESPVFDLQISPDRLEATLGITNASLIKKVAFDEVMGFLKENGITYGIHEECIHRFCDSDNYTSRVLCAKGIPCIDGEDGSLHYNINTEKDLRPKEREDGTVDYRDLGIVENVREGEVLCELIPPTEGKDGINVYNEVIPYKQGRTPGFPTGTNTVISEDGMSLVSRVDGSVEYKNNQINVYDVFVVHGDVNSVTGNIHSVSSVIVQGDVLEGFIIKSEKDVIVRGMVEGAIIEAEGNITISNGMMGMGHGILRAGGNVTAKYFENGTIIAKGDVFAENFINCRVETDSTLILKGKNATLIGGSYKAGKSISAKNLGNSSHTKTVVSIASKRLDEIYAMSEGSDNIDVMQNKLSEFQKALDLLQQQIQTVSDSITPEEQGNADKKRVWLKAANTKKEQINAAIQTLQRNIELEEDGNMQLSDYKIMVSGITYPGVKIEIGPYNLQIQQENSCTKFYGNMHEIVFSPLLKAEME